jgi:hypothetical protein
MALQLVYPPIYTDLNFNSRIRLVRWQDLVTVSGMNPADLWQNLLTIAKRNDTHIGCVFYPNANRPELRRLIILPKDQDFLVSVVIVTPLLESLGITSQ